MFRPLCIGCIALTAVSLGSFCLRARAGARDLRAQVARRLHSPSAMVEAARRGKGATTFSLPLEFIGLADNDGDEELSRGDMVTVHGGLADQQGNIVGTWEGTLVDSSPDNLFLNLTFLFAGKGTATVVGAPYADGSRREVDVAPVVGKTGRIRFREASLGVDEQENFTITFFR